ncbi:hypothetical protein FGG08_006795 [Glutinoglossum americanum]|uniref:Uncharacterized protein n=1 Tax=Glutinoglossum americanum TaxID=1670608 RepID=A0A9P8HRY8_9PEZI|nr:hypothetical protein FGG08_006795 [Glutinoglossum americanum]
MLNRFMKAFDDRRSNDPSQDEPVSTTSRRRAESIVSSSSGRKPSSATRGDDRDRSERVYIPASTSYASTLSSTVGRDDRDRFGERDADWERRGDRSSKRNSDYDGDYQSRAPKRVDSVSSRSGKERSSKDSERRHGRDRDEERSSKRDRSGSRDRRNGKKDRSRSRERRDSKRDRSRSRERRDSKRDRSRSRERRDSKRDRSRSRDRRDSKRDRSTSRDRRGSKRDRSRSRDRADRQGNYDRDDKRRDSKDSREKEGRRDKKSRGQDQSEKDRGVDRAGPQDGSNYSVQAPGTFSAQVGGQNFSQPPGKYNASGPQGPGYKPPTSIAPQLSSKVPNQFPGQFPAQTTAPYRPPLSANEGGPGLASDYYGDQGQSVLDQPGVRPKPPSLIVGAEPHLQAASPVDARPPEPSATGGVGAAADYFSGTGYPSGQPSSSNRPPSKPAIPGKQGKVSGAAVIAGGAALAGAASGAASGGGNSGSSASFYQQGSNPPSVATSGYPPPPVPSSTGYTSTHTANAYPPPPIPVSAGHSNGYSHTTAPTSGTGQPFVSSVAPVLGAAAVGAAASHMVGHTGSSSQHQQQQHISGSSHHPQPVISASPSHYVSASSTPSAPTSGTGQHFVSSVVPVLGAAAVGAAASHMVGHSGSSSQHQQQQQQQQHISGSSHHPQPVISASPSHYVSASSTPSAPTSGTGQHFVSSVVPVLGAAAVGAAASHMVGHSGSSSQHQQQQQQHQHISGSSHHPQPVISVSPSHYVSASSTPSASVRPHKHGKHSPSHSNAGLYAAGAAGLGAAVLAHQNSHHKISSEHYSVAGSTHSMGAASGSIALQQRRRGPVGKLVDFWRDPEGVGRFEEYTEAIGVCKYCFEAGSTPRDAPRKHRYHDRRRGSNDRLSERYGSSARIDKDSRYSSSDNAAGHRHRARSKKSMIAAGLGVYGLAKLGKSMLGRDHHSGDNYSVRSDRSTGSSRWSFFKRRSSYSPDRRSRTSYGVATRSRSRSRDRSSHHSSHRSSHHTSHHTAAAASGLVAGSLVAGSSHSTSRSSRHRSRSRSRDRTEIGITRDGHVYKRETHRGPFGGTTTTYVDPDQAKHRHHRERSRSRSRSRDKHSGLLGAAVGAAVGVAASSSYSKHRHRSRSNSPRGEFVRPRKRSSGGRHSPQSQVSISNVARSSTGSIFGGFFSSQSSKSEKQHRARKKRGFFSFGNSSSSSSDFGLVYGPGSESRRRRRSRSGSRSGSVKEKRRPGADAAIAGLGTAAALMAASEMTKSKHNNRGKRPSKDGGRKGSKHYKASSRRSSSSSSSPSEDEWESDVESIEDSNLAFGSFHDSRSTASRKSQDSLGSDTSSSNGGWLWPWGGKRRGDKKKKPRNTVYPSDSVSHGGSFISPAASGLIGAATGAAVGAAIASGGRGESPSSSTQGPLQKVHPIFADPGGSEATRHSSISSHTQPILTARPAPVPIQIQHPQPVVPVSQAVFSNQGPPTAYPNQGPPPPTTYPVQDVPHQPSYIAPSGPPVFPVVPPVQQGKRAAPAQHTQPNVFNYQVKDDSFITRSEENRIPTAPRRRASSPTIVTVGPSTSSVLAREARDPTTGVRFKLTQEQTERQARDRKSSDRKSKDDEERREQGRSRESIQQAEIARDRARYERERLEKEDQLRDQADRERAERERARIREQEQDRVRAQTERDRSERERMRVREQERMRAQAEDERLEREEKERSKREREREIARLKKAGEDQAERKIKRDYEEREYDRERVAREKGKSDAWVAPVAAGAIGAAVGAFAAGSAVSRAREEHRDQDQDRRQKTADKSDRDDYHCKTGSQSDRQADIARKAAAKVIADRSNDDYSNVPSVVDKYKQKDEPVVVYVAPPELLEKKKEQSGSRPTDRDGHYHNQGYQEYHDSATYTGDVAHPSDVQTYHAPEIVTTAPRGPPYSPGYNFTAYKDGIDPSHMSLPWTVPGLHLIQPTPPGSVAGGSWKGPVSVPGTPIMTPVIAPVDPSSAVPPIEIVETKTQPSVPKSSQKESQSREFSADLPSGTRETAIVDPPKGGESAKRRSSKVSTGSEKGTKIPQVEGKKTSQMPGSFEDDIEFAATLAAGLQESGFDPSIVIEDHTYHQRDSPHGSEEEYTAYKKSSGPPGGTSSYRPIKPSKPTVASSQIIDSDEDEDTEYRRADLPSRYAEEPESNPRRELNKNERGAKDWETKRQLISEKSAKQTAVAVSSQIVDSDEDEATGYQRADLPSRYVEKPESNPRRELNKNERGVKDRETKRQSISEKSTKQAAVAAPSQIVDSDEDRDAEYQRADLPSRYVEKPESSPRRESNKNERGAKDRETKRQSISEKPAKQAAVAAPSQIVDSDEDRDAEYQRADLPSRYVEKPESSPRRESNKNERGVKDRETKRQPVPDKPAKQAAVAASSQIVGGDEDRDTEYQRADLPSRYVEKPESSPGRELSRKEQKAKDREAKRQSVSDKSVKQPMGVQDNPVASLDRDLVAEPESYFEEAQAKGKKSKKSKRDSVKDPRDIEPSAKNGATIVESPWRTSKSKSNQSESDIVGYGDTGSTTGTTVSSTGSTKDYSERGSTATSISRKSRDKKEKRKSREGSSSTAVESGRITQDQYSKVHIPSFSGMSSSLMAPDISLTRLEAPTLTDTRTLTKKRREDGGSSGVPSRAEEADKTVVVASASPQQQRFPKGTSGQRALSPVLEATTTHSPDDLSMAVAVTAAAALPSSVRSQDNVPYAPLSNSKDISTLPASSRSTVDFHDLPHTLASAPPAPSPHPIKPRSLPPARSPSPPTPPALPDPAETPSLSSRPTPILDDLPALPASRPSSPTLEPVQPRSRGPVFSSEILPALPAGKPSSPTLEPVQPRSQEPVFSSEILPALPASKPSSPTLEPAQPRSQEPVFSSDILPALPASRPSSPTLEPAQPRSQEPVFSSEILPALPASKPSSPTLEPAQPRSQEPIFSSDILPALPASRPSSPTLEPVQPRSQEPVFIFSSEILPALPASRPSSPTLGSTQPRSQEPVFSSDILPALPASRSSSPTLEPAQPRSQEPVFSSEILPALPASRPSSPTLGSTQPRSQEPVFSSDILPALPASRPSSPTLEPAQPRSQEPIFSSEILPVLPISDLSLPLIDSLARSLPSGPAVDLNDLPALPLSTPPSPLSEPVQPPSLPSGPVLLLDDLPPLPASGPSSPLLEATQLPLEQTLSLEDLPPLPSSSPSSPLLGATRLPPKPTPSLEDLPPLPPSGPSSSPSRPLQPLSEPALSLEDLPSLPLSGPCSPLSGPLQPLPKLALNLESLPPPLSGPSSPLSGPPQPLSEPVLSLRDLPALPLSNPSSPLLENVPSRSMPIVSTHNLDNTPVPPASRPSSPPAKLVLSQQSSERAFESMDLPALPASRPSSPYSGSEPAKPLSEPTRSLDALLSESTPNLNDLPALPPSTPSSPLLESAQPSLPFKPTPFFSSPSSGPEGAKPLPEPVQSLDPLPPKAPLSLDGLPPLPISEPSSPPLEPVPAQRQPELALDINDLPMLPNSRPSSPYSAQETIQPPELTRSLGDLPILPSSGNTSLSPEPQPTQSQPLMSKPMFILGDLPALPKSRPSSPTLESKPAQSLPEPVFGLNELPTLPVGAPTSPQLEHIQQPPPSPGPIRGLEVLPPLPHSSPVSSSPKPARVHTAQPTQIIDELSITALPRPSPPLPVEIPKDEQASLPNIDEPPPLSASGPSSPALRPLQASSPTSQARDIEVASAKGTAQAPIPTEPVLVSPPAEFEGPVDSLLSATLVDEGTELDSVAGAQSAKKLKRKKGKGKETPTPSLTEEDEILPEFLASRKAPLAVTSPSKILDEPVAAPDSAYTKLKKNNKGKDTLSPASREEDEASQMSTSTLVSQRRAAEALGSPAAAPDIPIWREKKTKGKKGKKRTASIPALAGDEVSQELESTTPTATGPPETTPIPPLKEVEAPSTSLVPRPKETLTETSREGVLNEPTAAAEPSIYTRKSREDKKGKGNGSSVLALAAGETSRGLESTASLPEIEPTTASTEAGKAHSTSFVPRELEEVTLAALSLAEILDRTAASPQPSAYTEKGTGKDKEDKEGKSPVSFISGRDKPLSARSMPQGPEEPSVATVPADVADEPVADSEPSVYTLKKGKKDKKGKKRVFPASNNESETLLQPDPIPLAVASLAGTSSTLDPKEKDGAQPPPPTSREPESTLPIAANSPELVDKPVTEAEPPVYYPSKKPKRGSKQKKGKKGEDATPIGTLIEGAAPLETEQTPATAITPSAALPIQDLKEAEEIPLPPPTPEELEPAPITTTRMPEILPVPIFTETEIPQEPEAAPLSTAETSQIQISRDSPPSSSSLEEPGPTLLAPANLPETSDEPVVVSDSSKDKQGRSTFAPALDGGDIIPSPAHASRDPEVISSTRSLPESMDEVVVPGPLANTNTKSKKSKKDKKGKNKAAQTWADTQDIVESSLPTTTGQQEILPVMPSKGETSPPSVARGELGPAPPAPLPAAIPTETLPISAPKEVEEIPPSPLTSQEPKVTSATTTLPQILDEPTIPDSSVNPKKKSKTDKDKRKASRDWMAEAPPQPLLSQEHEVTPAVKSLPEVLDETVVSTPPIKATKKSKKDKKGKKRSSQVLTEEGDIPSPFKPEEPEEPESAKPTTTSSLETLPLLVLKGVEQTVSPPIASQEPEATPATSSAEILDTTVVSAPLVESKKKTKKDKGKKGAAQTQMEGEAPAPPAEPKGLESTQKATTDPLEISPASVSKAKDKISSSPLAIGEPEPAPPAAEIPTEISSTPAVKDTDETMLPSLSSKELELTPFTTTTLVEALPTPALKQADEVPSLREPKPSAPAEAIPVDASDESSRVTDSPFQTTKLSKKDKKGKKMAAQALRGEEELPQPPSESGKLESLPLVTTSPTAILDESVTASNVLPQVTKKPKKDKKGKKRNSQAWAEEEETASIPLAPKEPELTPSATASQLEISDETSSLPSARGLGPTLAAVATPADALEKSTAVPSFPVTATPKKDKKGKATSVATTMEDASFSAREGPEPTGLLEIVDETMPISTSTGTKKPKKNKKGNKGKSSKAKDEIQPTITSPAELLDEPMAAPISERKARKDKKAKATFIPSNEEDEIPPVTTSPAEMSDEPSAVSDSTKTFQRTSPEGAMLETPDLPRELSEDRQMEHDPRAESLTAILTRDQPRETESATIQPPGQRQTQTPTKTALSTAVPLFRRRPTTSPGITRSPFSSPSAPQDPSTRSPHTRKSRPGSTEFKSSTEIRPLYLVERHRTRQEIEQEETYPSLPSSRTTSRSPSLHEEEARKATETSEGLSQAPSEGAFPWGGHHDELGQDHSNLRIDVDRSTESLEPPGGLLGSGQSTPKAVSFSQVHDDTEHAGKEHGFAAQLSLFDQGLSRGLFHGPEDLLSSIGDLSNHSLDRSDRSHSEQQQDIGTRSVEDTLSESFISSLPSLPLSRPDSLDSLQQEGLEIGLPRVPTDGSISPYPEQHERTDTSSIEPAQTESFISSLPSLPLDGSVSSCSGQQQSTEPGPTKAVKPDLFVTRPPGFPLSRSVSSPKHQQSTEIEPVEPVHDDLSSDRPRSSSLGSSYTERQSTKPDSVGVAHDDSVFGNLPPLPFPFTRSDSYYSEQQYGTSTTSSDPLNISVELSSSYEFSVSRPPKDHSGSDSGPSVEIVFNPRQQSTEGVARDQTAVRQDVGVARARSIDDLPEPSPVESTSKERDSILFKTPPAKDRLGGSPSPRPSPESSSRGRSKDTTPHTRDITQPKKTQRRARPDVDHSPSPQPREIGDIQTLQQVRLDVEHSPVPRSQEIDDAQTRHQIQGEANRPPSPRPEDTQPRVRIGIDHSPSPRPQGIGNTQSPQQVRIDTDVPQPREVDDMQTQRRVPVRADTSPSPKPRKASDAQTQRRVQRDASHSPSPQPLEMGVARTPPHRPRALEASSPPPSLFGGPTGANSDISGITIPAIAGIAAGIGFVASEKRRLGTITEDNPDDSPLSKKGRSVSGQESVGRNAKRELPSISPEIPRDEDRPPPADPTDHNLTRSVQRPTSTRETKLISTEDLLARLSWPVVDENEHTVDIDRGASRGPGDKSPSRSSNISPITPDRPLAREANVRSPTGHSARSSTSIHRYKTPENTRDKDNDRQYRPSSVLSNPIRPTSALSDRAGSVLSNRSLGLVGTPRTPPRTPPLRRVDRSVSGDLRAASKREQRKLASDPPPELFLPSSSTYDPLKDKGKGRARDMADVYEGFGDVQGSPLSPTRPPSIMRRRHSMQIMDLETKIDQLVSENRLLAEAKAKAEESLEDSLYNQQRGSAAEKEALETRDLEIRTKDTEIGQLKETLERVQKEVVRLTEANQSILALNASLTAQSLALRNENSNRDDRLEATTKQLEDKTGQLESLRRQHGELTGGMEAIVRHEISVALEEKNAQLRHLKTELLNAKEKIRTLQRQILESKPSENFLITRDEDYFETACQTLCQHVKEWVLRFSKFSDSKQCRLLDEVEEDKVRDRVDNTILDDTEVDDYLRDRVKRRDVFMSVVMIMVWEYIFTRYLFGMDREQRQKLKALEKTLADVGPPAAVHQWRATTLTLLSRRPAFLTQREQDTEAVVQEIYHTLSALLPPPSHLISQILDSLRNVMRSAVELSIEMRTQRAEYMMLPPLHPEYDQNGDLLRKIHFNALTMNERSGDTPSLSNEDLEDMQAVVRIVLFPLVVKKGDQTGAGEEEIVVCPAQVLIAKPAKDKQVSRVVSGDMMSIDAPLPTASAQSMYSSMDMGGMI